MKRTYQPI